MTDERDKRDRNTETYTRQLVSQTADLRFLSTQYAFQVESEKKRAEASNAKVEDVFARIGMITDAPGKVSKTEKIFQRLQKIDIETGLGTSF